MLRRFVLTGAPGSGKTSVLIALSALGHAVIEEAATEVIVAAQAHGIDAPWERDDFVDLVVTLQRERQLRPVPAGTLVQVFDRSPLCTLALAHYMNRPVTPLLKQEIARVVEDQVYDKRVFFVRPLGFIERTAARRISPRDALAFEALHEQVYCDHGFTLVDVRAGPVPGRADAIHAHLLAALT